MSKNQRQTPRKPATKFAHLQKKMQKSAMSQVSSSVGECRQRLTDTEREYDQVERQRREFIEEA